MLLTVQFRKIRFVNVKPIYILLQTRWPSEFQWLRFNVKGNMRCYSYRKILFLWKNHRKNKETQITTVERIIHNTITRVSHLLMGLSHSSTEVSIYFTHRSIPKNVIFFQILETDCRKPLISRKYCLGIRISPDTNF